MIKSTAIWVLSLVLVALLLTQVGYRLLERKQSPPVEPADSNVSEQASASSDEGRADSASHDTGQADQMPLIASQSGLQGRLLAMTEPERNQIFYLIIRDADAKCIDIVSSQYVIADGAWLAHCGETQNYSIVIDAVGSISVYPIPYFTPPREIPEPR